MKPGVDARLVREFKRALRKFAPFGSDILRDLEFASKATRDECARRAEQAGYDYTARWLRR